MLFKKLDAIKTQIDTDLSNSDFRQQIEKREKRYVHTIEAEGDNLLRVMAKLIAYSNNAQSDRVTELLKKDVFEEAFHHFDVAVVAKDRQERVVESHWDDLKAIRHKKKVGYIIKCANVLMKEGAEKSTIESLRQQCRIPVELKSAEDVDVFWREFDALRAWFKQEKMPYFKNTTTLLHLLLHLGFPCLKPDLIVMKVAAELGMVEARENHNQYRPSERKAVVRSLQEYCVSRGMTPAVLDLYLLAYGGQRGVNEYCK